MNKLFILGNLCKDIEVRNAGDKTVSVFSIAVKRQFSKDKTDFLNCEAWGKTGEYIQKYYHKGDEIMIIGRVEIDTWETEGKKNYKTTIRVDEAVATYGKKTVKNSDEEFVTIDEADDDGLPF